MRIDRGSSTGLQYIGIGIEESSDFHWRLSGSILERSYRVLVRESKQGFKKLSSAGSMAQVQGPELSRSQQIGFFIAFEKQQLIRPAAMLAGMALECYFKAAIAVSRRPPKGNHDLVKLAKAANLFKALQDHEATLAELSSMIQLGRYFMSTTGQTTVNISTKQTDEVLKSTQRELRKVFG